MHKISRGVVKIDTVPGRDPALRIQRPAEPSATFDDTILQAGPQDGPWRMTGIDPAGIDIVGRASTLRLEFKNRVTTPEEARATFKKLAETARAKPA